MQKIIINFIIFTILVINLLKIAESCNTSNGFYESDRIESLPGLKSNLSSAHFSGYLNVSAEHRLFYYLATSQNDTANNPLIFWFNGGPGYSSLYGSFAEMGPYLINPDGETLRPNPNAWNKNASIVYLESPYWVGNSYSTIANETGWNDEKTTDENYEAIKQFMQKFPAFRQHRLFLTGESYAGVYIPLLAEKIVDGMQNYSLNFEGIAIGNGYFNVTLNQLTQQIYGYFHGFLDDASWDNFTKSCGGFEQLDHCDPKILDWFYQNSYPDPWTQLNEYDIYEDCHIVSNASGYLPATLVSPPTGNGTMPPAMANQTLVCENGYYEPSLIKYLNLPKVRKNLHVAKGANKTWNAGNEIIGDQYQFQHDAGVEKFVKKVLDAGVRVLLYAGDADIVCNYILVQKFARNLGLKPDRGQYSWSVPGIDITNAGTLTNYLGGGGLTFTTIRGAGHMVPQKKGPQIYFAIEAFLNNRRNFGLSEDNLIYMGLFDGST